MLKKIGLLLWRIPNEFLIHLINEEILQGAVKRLDVELECAKYIAREIETTQGAIVTS